MRKGSTTIVYIQTSIAFWTTAVFYAKCSISVWIYTFCIRYCAAFTQSVWLWLKFVLVVQYNVCNKWLNLHIMHKLLVLHKVCNHWWVIYLYATVTKKWIFWVKFKHLRCFLANLLLSWFTHFLSKFCDLKTLVAYKFWQISCLPPP